MISATPPDLRSPWREFLTEVDRLLSGPVRLHCLGGFVTAVQHGLNRTTNDLDYIEVVPHDKLQVLQELAGPQSELARNLHLFALEPHDLALSKLARNSPIDREDVARLANIVPLDPSVLRQRYQEELRPILIGDLRNHDLTLEMWIESYFPQGGRSLLPGP